VADSPESGALNSVVLEAGGRQRRPAAFRHLGIGAWRIDEIDELTIVRMRIIRTLG
jgi:hypothetical protein